MWLAPGGRDLLDGASVFHLSNGGHCADPVRTRGCASPDKCDDLSVFIEKEPARTRCVLKDSFSKLNVL